MDVDDQWQSDESDGLEPLPDEIVAALRAVPVDEFARERAISAALAEAPRRSRRDTFSMPLVGAAAAVVLLAAGAVLLSPRGGDDADLAIEEPVALEAATSDIDAADLAVESAVPEFDEESASDRAMAPAADVAEEEDSEMSVADDTASSTDDYGAIVPEELFDEAVEALAAIRESDLEPPDTDCVMIGGGPVTVTRFRGVDVVLFLDLANATVTALAVDDCSFVVDHRADS